MRLYIKEHTLPFRDNCPVCGNKNTFGAIVLNGQILYNCFHASCGIKGRLNYELSLADIIRHNIDSSNNNINHIIGTKQKLEFIIPEYWISPLQNDRCFKFLQYWGILDLYASRSITIWYDPKLDRCVFMLFDKKGKCHGAVGRALTYPSYPKWFVYQRSNGCPFMGIISKRPTCILVEDAVSAAVCGNRGINSIAILGTSISEATIQHLLGDFIYYIALDKDATVKSIKIQKQLAPYVNAKILPIEKDLKYYSKEELQILKQRLEENGFK